MRAIVIAAAVFSLAGAVHAQSTDAPPPWSGVWRGALGDLQVRACFGTDSGSYYYLRHLKLIPLEHDEKSWTERSGAKDAAHWTLAPGGGDTLIGTWSGGGRALPIRLTRVTLSKAPNAVTGTREDEDPCGGMTFQAPRIVQPRVTRKSAVVDGARYTRLIADVGKHFGADIETFALDASTPAAQRINTALAKTLPRLGAEAPDYLVCTTQATGQFGEDGEFVDVLKPVLLTRRWLVSEEVNSGSCGGAHPYAGINYRLWSLTAGKTVDPWSWFIPSVAAKKPDQLPQISQRLRKVLTARWRSEDKECADIADDTEDWDIHPTRKGLAFWPQLPHVVFACSDDIVVPYRDLAPLLNAEGRAYVASITRDLQALPPPRP
ncbi:MAG TPA: hypothetical protein VG407_06905 [Caulobacteraceae bacterium]|jgi:hypothetical protein|nr:hypothetical protein [Caulobacteraceae bacterium]